MILIKPDELRKNVCSFVHGEEDMPCPNQITSCLWSKVRVCDFNRIIDNTSTVEAEPIKHGKWIDHQYKEYPIGRYECSVCGARHDMEWDYCPFCGARMDGRENG